MKELRGHDLSDAFILELTVNAWLEKNNPEIKWNKTKKRLSKPDDQNLKSNLESKLEKIQPNYVRQSAELQKSNCYAKQRSRYIATDTKKMVWKREIEGDSEIILRLFKF